MNKAMRRIVAKVEALTARVKVLEGAVAVREAYEMAEFRAKHPPAKLADLGAFVTTKRSDRGTAVEVGRLIGPLLVAIPEGERARLIATSTPVDMVEAITRAVMQTIPELAPVLDATASALRHHALTWADLGIGADGVMA